MHKKQIFTAVQYLTGQSIGRQHYFQMLIVPSLSLAHKKKTMPNMQKATENHCTANLPRTQV